MFHTWSEILYKSGSSSGVGGGGGGDSGGGGGGGDGGGGEVRVGDVGILGLFRALGFGDGFTNETLVRWTLREPRTVLHLLWSLATFIFPTTTLPLAT